MIAETSLTASDDARSDAVKRARCPECRWRSIVVFTILLTSLAFAMPTKPALADDLRGTSRFERPAPHVTRQVDRLSRDGAADPLTRRQLQDQLRREPPSAQRSSDERTLRQLPDATSPAPRPLPTSPEPDPLPSSLPPGFDNAGDGGFVPPPGNRGEQR